MLKEGERLDDLQIDGLRLIQNPELYCFTSDAVLLANAVRVKKGGRIVDLCSGSGVIGILTAVKRQPSEVVCVELQSVLAEMSERSVKLNNLDDKVRILNISVQEAPAVLGCETVDTVVCNPPYAKADSGQTAKCESVAICRTELKLTLSELCVSAAKLLKFCGKFFVVHRADRLAELFYELKKNNLEPKKLTLIKPKVSKVADTVIVEAVKGGKVGLVTDTLVVFKEDNTYTKRVKSLYFKE